MVIVQALVVVVVALVVAGGVAIGAGQGGAMALGVPVMVWLAMVAFAINWLAFVPAFLRRTERFYDLVGSATFTTTTLAALVLSGHVDARAIVPATLVLLWALRLGTFLFKRVHDDGGDGRFDEIKQSAPRFLIAWTLQALWVFLTASAAFASITSTARPPVDVGFVIGLLVWLAGFVVEVVADRQKRIFKRDGRRGRFIQTGLWAWSRHPNYFGEILLWTGMLVLSSATLSGWSWVVVLSPVFVTLLLTKVSGIPLLEARADARFGDDVDYQRYKASTPVLIPRPPRRPTSSPTTT
jgi:steroid 5-alpha reductase family enzyme